MRVLHVAINGIWMRGSFRQKEARPSSEFGSIQRNICRQLAQTRHQFVADQCPLLGLKQTLAYPCYGDGYGTGVLNRPPVTYRISVSRKSVSVSYPYRIFRNQVRIRKREEFREEL